MTIKTSQLTTTVKDIIKRNPCYLKDMDKGRPYLRKLYKARKNWTALQIIEEIGPQFTIPAEDILRTVLHKSLVDTRTLQLLSARFACDMLVDKNKIRRKKPTKKDLEAVKTMVDFAWGRVTEDQLEAKISFRNIIAFYTTHIHKPNFVSAFLYYLISHIYATDAINRTQLARVVEALTTNLETFSNKILKDIEKARKVNKDVALIDEKKTNHRGGMVRR